MTGGLLRQILYATTRLGVYNSLYAWQRGRKNAKGKHMNIIDRLTIGTVAGAVGACVGNPGEVVLIRMSADGRLPPEQRRNYKNCINALTRITKEEGFSTLFTGLKATVFRSMVHNAAQLGMYSQSKQFYWKTLKLFKQYNYYYYL